MTAFQKRKRKRNKLKEAGGCQLGRRVSGSCSVSALCAPWAFSHLTVAECQGFPWWLPHGTFKGKLSYQFWGPELPYSILVPILRVESSKATSLWLLWGCSGSSLLLLSLGQKKKKGHLVSSIAFPQLLKLGTELRGCCHLNRLLNTSKTLAVVGFGHSGGCCARCQESQPWSLWVNVATGWWVLSALPWAFPTQPFSCLDVLVCLGCLCVGARFGPTVSRSSHCSACRGDMAHFQPAPQDVEDSNASFYRRVESPAWDCFDL